MRNKKVIFAITVAILTVASGCGATDKGQQGSSTSDTLVTESQTKFTETKTEMTENELGESDFSSIDGDWYIDGDVSAAHITISSSGRFTAYYANGNVENTGYVKYEREELEEGISNWYVLYTDDDNIYLAFIDDGSERKLEFYEGNGSTVHYVWTSGIGGIADDGRGEDEIFVSENYIGIWGCGRATLVISENDDGSYFGKITWADSAFAYVEWEYALTYDAESQSMICNGNATKTYYQYEDGNTEPTVTVLYTNGSGSFYLSNDVLIWNDMEENSGEDMEFVRSE